MDNPHLPISTGNLIIVDELILLFSDKKESSSATNPHELVKSIDVAHALRNACGQHAQLDSFEIKDFTKKGDNYACVVSSVKVQYKLNGKSDSISFVVKLNPCRGNMGMGAMSDVVFKKESEFYEKIMPKLNGVLKRNGLTDIRAPVHYFSVTKPSAQVIYLEDMRTKGYKMCDRKKGMDEHHTYLILQELGRFHAASVIWMNAQENKEVDLKETYDALKEAMDMMYADQSDSNIGNMFTDYLEKSAVVAENNKGYEYVAEYLRGSKGGVVEKFQRVMDCPDNIKVINHGDCWNNNFLFRFVQNK